MHDVPIEETESTMKTLVVLIIIAAIVVAVWKSKQAKAIDNSELNNIQALPPSVGRAVEMMDPVSQSAFFNEYQMKKKSLAAAYILWLIFGAHYIYFRKVGLQIAFWLTWFIGIGILWWLIDLFRMPSIRRQFSEQVARQALQTLQTGASFRSSSIKPPSAGD